MVAGRRVLRARADRRQLSSYFTKGVLPLKYLLPGLMFLFVFQLYTMVFTAYLSFTNYGTGHLDDKDAAIIAIQSAERGAGRGRHASTRSCRSCRTARCRCWSPTRTPGEVRIATNDGFTEVPEGDIQRDGDRVTGVDRLREPQPRDAERATPTTTPSGTRCSRRSTPRPASISGRSRSRGRPRRGPGYVYDEAQDAMVNTTTGDVYPADSDIGQLRVRDDRRTVEPGLAGERRVRQLRRAVHRLRYPVGIPADHGLDVLLRHSSRRS